MQVTATIIPDVLVVEPKVFGDARGFFFESFNAKAFEVHEGVVSRCRRGVNFS